MENLVYDDLKASLDIAGIKHSYISNTNTLALFTDLLTFTDVDKLVKDFTKAPEQFSLKMTIIETNVNEIKDRGTNLSAYMQSLEGDTQYFLQLLTMPFSAGTSTFTDAKQGYYGVLRYLNENGYTKLNSSPYMTVQSGKGLYFSAVQNIPYKTASSSVNGASESQTETIDYQDVGLKILLKPQIVDDIIYCNIEFTMESLIDKGSLTPSTSKREFNSDFQLKKGQILVLGGINQTDIQHTHYGIPLLENIPFLGEIFQYDHKEEIERVLTLTIEVL